MSRSHPNCTNGHVCQQPSGRICIEAGCNKPAGTLWGPMWCPEHDRVRLDRIAAQLTEIAAAIQANSHHRDASDERIRRAIRDRRVP